MTWCDLEIAAPEVARLGKEYFDRAGVALLGTLRADGSPRISPVGLYLTRGRLLFGVMSRSAKARDLLRDHRCVLHSAVSDPDPEGEFKLYGRAREVQDHEVRDGCTEAWWVSRPPEDARVFSLSIEQAIFISWDTEHGLMTVRRWSPKAGLSEVVRNYP